MVRRVAMVRRGGRRFAPVWVYFFGLFALATLQRWLYPPDQHGVGANVAFFGIGAVVVIALITIAERATHKP